MACLAFGRAALQSHPSFGAEGPPVGAPCAASMDECQLRQLAVPEDPARIAAEAAVFDALAQQVTAFIVTLDEATVNCGAAEAGAGAATAGGHASAALSDGRGSAAGPAAAGGCSTAGCGTAGGSTASPGASPRSGSLSLGRAGSGGSAGSCGPSQRTASGPSSSSGSSSNGSLASGAGLWRLSAAHHDAGFGWRQRRAAFEAAKLRENRVERLVARSDAAGAERRLQHRLLVARLEAVAFRGCSGGNSLFDALSLALWGTAAYGRALRALGVVYAAEHPAEYRSFLGDDWRAYLSGMALPGVPGDELMLRAVADHFGLNVNIVTADPFMWLQRYAPVKTRSQREVTLAFLGPCTWMPVRRQSAITTLRLSLSGSSEWRQAREIRRKMQQLDLQPGSPR